jgi:NAD(P)-dependent dehydrogenase (short-subunit alcohol dehydrogenase family)
MIELKDKIILITGAAAGIGNATAKLAAQRGASVVLADIDATNGAQAAAELGGLFIPVNVADEASVQAMYAAIAERFGRLDALVHAAGILRGAHVPLSEFDLATWRSVLDVNLTGAWLCAQHAAPLMRQARKGVMLLVSSIAAILGSSSFAYGASKAGINGLALTLERQLAAEKIRVNVVMPGSIDTDMKRNVIAVEAEQRGVSLASALAASNLGDPEGVARVLVWLTSDDADYVRGAIRTR